MTALLSYDPDLSPETNKDMMLEAASNVGTGQVTFAARDSEFGMKKIKYMMQLFAAEQIWSKN